MFMFNSRVSWSLLAKSRYILITLLIVLIFFFLYFWRLGNLTPGLSPAENIARSHSSSLSGTANNPINLPQVLPQSLIQKVGKHGAFWMRLPTVLIALTAFYIFYRLLKSWFGRFSAVLGLLLLAATPLVIITARSATPSVLLLFPAVLLPAILFSENAGQGFSVIKWLSLTALAAFCFYIPGMVWVLGMAIVFGRQKIKIILKDLNPIYIIMCFLLFIILISPLVLQAYQHPNLIKSVFAIPEHWKSVTEVAKSFGWSLSALFWETRQHEIYNLGRMPILNIIQSALVIFGGFVLWNRIKYKTYFLMSTIAVGYITASINTNMLFLFISMPALIIFMTAGLRYLYAEWRNRFPNNPLPRTLAMVLLISLLTIQVMIGVRVALVAWPHTASTKDTYMIK
jgi:hypothetical protein